MDLQDNFDCFSGLLLFYCPPFYLLKIFIYLIFDAVILYCTSGISKCEVHGHLGFHAYRMIVTEAHLLVLPWVSLLWSSRAEHSKAFQCKCLSGDICQGQSTGVTGNAFCCEGSDLRQGESREDKLSLQAVLAGSPALTSKILCLSDDVTTCLRCTP